MLDRDSQIYKLYGATAPSKIPLTENSKTVVMPNPIQVKTKRSKMPPKIGAAARV
jgi:hypothetical protein